MDESALCADLERRYLECFCRRTREGFFVRYADPALPEMIDHNFWELRKPVGERLLRKTLEERLSAARAAGASHFRLELGFDPAGQPDAFPPGGEAEHCGRWALRPDPAAVAQWGGAPEAEVRPLAAPEDAEALAELELAADGERCGRVFCLRRAERRSRVYRSGGPCRCLLAWEAGRAAGACTLFCHGGGAVLEDLLVRPEDRRRGIGGALLRAAALRALAEGCGLLVLTADEEDTPRVWYASLGFVKQEDVWALTWRL
jgi:GNAT superfamily N-acetyltransferase